MQWTGEAIVCAVQPHGEHDAIVRLFSADAGLLVGYVRAARASRNRAIWLPGNLVQAHWHLRTENQLGSLVGDIVKSRADLFFADPATGAALSWVSALLSANRAERVASPQLFEAITAVLDILSLADAPLLWATAVVRFELLILSDAGFGLDLRQCAATGSSDDLVYVSPKSAQAVSRSAGLPYHSQLLALPAFMRDGAGIAASWAELHQAYGLTGYFLERHLLVASAAKLVSARRQFLQRLPQLD